MTDMKEKTALKTSPAAAVRVLLRHALKGALATLEPETGAPYASLVTLATAADGAPLLLLSSLAIHTRNLTADPRISLMIDGTDAVGDPLAGGRVSVLGTIAPDPRAESRRRFLQRHPEAEMYATFADFQFYTVHIERAHFVGGFGRIVDLTARDCLLDVSGAGSLIEAEAEIVEHMNADHADALALYAALHTATAPVPGDWKLTGLDPEGLDLVGPGARPLRIVFSEPVLTPAEVRRALVVLAARARSERTG